MKTVPLTDEQYTALLSLGVIKEEQDPHKGFVVGKKYRHIDKVNEAYYCGINEEGLPVFELITHEFIGPSGIWGGIPKAWVSKGNNTYFGHSKLTDSFDPTPIEEGIQPFEGTKWVRIDKVSDPYDWYSDNIGEVFKVKYYWKNMYICVHYDSLLIRWQDCTEVEAPKQLQPWEKYPTLDSSWNGDDRRNIDQDGKIFYSWGIYNYSTEAEARKAKATIFLSRIAMKWNQGVDDTGTYYFPLKNGENIKVDWFGGSSYLGNALPFKFNSAELAEKSLELFPDVWNDFYNK